MTFLNIQLVNGNVLLGGCFGLPGLSAAAIGDGQLITGGVNVPIIGNIVDHRHRPVHWMVARKDYGRSMTPKPFRFMWLDAMLIVATAVLVIVLLLI